MRLKGRTHLGRVDGSAARFGPWLGTVIACALAATALAGIVAVSSGVLFGDGSDDGSKSDGSGAAQAGDERPSVTVGQLRAATGAISARHTPVTSPVSPHGDAGDGAGVGVGEVAHGFWTQVASLERRLEGEPQDASALLSLARLMHDAHRFSEAVPYYERLLQIDPSERQVWFDLASVHASLGDWEPAIAVMKQLLEQYPADPAALYNLGAIHANRGQFAEATAYWGRVRAEAPGTEYAAKAADAIALVTRG